jgi:hypothetical protein
MNVTIPYKKTVIPFCDELSDLAKEIGSVNTLLRREDGSIFGDNTDAFGFETGKHIKRTANGIDFGCPVVAVRPEAFRFLKTDFRSLPMRQIISDIHVKTVCFAPARGAACSIQIVCIIPQENEWISDIDIFCQHG